LDLISNDLILQVMRVKSNPCTGLLQVQDSKRLRLSDF